MPHTVQTPIEVRYQETDQMGVVYHANYLVWFEIGRTYLINSLGFNYTDMEKEGILAPVINANVSFKKPILFGETAYVQTWIRSYNGLRTVYAYKILDEKGQTAITGETEHVIVKKDGFRPLSLRKAFPEWHQAYIKAMEGES